MTESNPYSAPAADLTRAHHGEFAITGPKATGIGRGWGWISEGFSYFMKNPGVWILTIVVALVIGIVMSVIPILGQIGLMSTSYVWMAGIMIGCHAMDRGSPLKLEYLFAGFKNPGKLIVLSLVAGVASTVIMFVAVGPIFLQLLTADAEPSPELIAALADPVTFWLPFLFGMLALIPLMMAIWFAPALIAINDVSVVEALKLSFVGCLKNALPMLLYGIIALVLYILGAIPLGLGLLAVFPALAASVYVSYKEIYIN